MFSYEDVKSDKITGNRIDYSDYDIIREFILSGSLKQAASNSSITLTEVKEILKRFKKLCPDQYSQMRSILKIVGTKKNSISPNINKVSDMNILEWLHEVEDE